MVVSDFQIKIFIELLAILFHVILINAHLFNNQSDKYQLNTVYAKSVQCQKYYTYSWHLLIASVIENYEISYV